jgi:hypothetical protein
MLGCYTLNFLKAYVENVNLRSGGATRGKRRIVGWKEQGV